MPHRKGITYQVDSYEKAIEMAKSEVTRTGHAAWAIEYTDGEYSYFECMTEPVSMKVNMFLMTVTIVRKERFTA